VSMTGRVGSGKREGRLFSIAPKERGPPSPPKTGLTQLLNFGKKETTGEKGGVRTVLADPCEKGPVFNLHGPPKPTRWKKKKGRELPEAAGKNEMRRPAEKSGPFRKK